MTHCSMLISLVFVISINLSFAQHDLICRSCDKATTLSDCPHRIICDNTMEECFIDKVITNSLTVVFNAGCRAKSICKLASLVGRKRDMTACSRCCNSHDCNRALCGLTHGMDIYTLALQLGGIMFVCLFVCLFTCVLIQNILRVFVTFSFDEIFRI
ncbi:uncharacterized protein LOC132737583 isoform X2 [Ruditapes philippinarum]|nr:uncharacterized protein LOC132737583 isoform X2 [Ruditapes philippinarum]XP_060580880.1 uncharacterized protein LOC132737583 isoform X2 [Ruditapes philippinarum]